MDSVENTVKKWRDRDWVWLTGFLILVIILLVASIFAKNTGVQINFSIVSSAVSIALALVAIFIALKQDSENKRVQDLTSRLLNGIDHRLLSVDEKVKSIDERVIRGITNQTIEVLNENDVGKDSYTKDEVKELIESLSENIMLKVKEETEESKYFKRINNYNKLLIQKRLYDIITNNPDMGILQIRDTYDNLYGENLPLTIVKQIYTRFNPSFSRGNELN